jgi:DNA-binding GntR family transcriptional regulator
VIRHDIGAGLSGPRLPAELQLAARYGVARAAARKALALLQEQGIVQRPGPGSIRR